MVDDNEGGGETEGEVDYEQPSVVVDVVSHAAEAEIVHLKHELAMENAQNEFQSHSMSSISINEAPLPPGVPKTGPMAGKKHATQQAAATKSITISTTTSAPFSAPISASAQVSASISASTSTSALASTSDSASTSTTISHESSLSLSAGTSLIANPAEGLKNEMSKVRNRWKAAAMKVVRDEYGLNGTHEQIKARATFILQDFRYVYIRSDSPKLEYRRERPFEHICIANVVKMCAFTHHQSIARLKETALKPVPAQVIALTTIVIHNAVAQWRETGKLKNISLEDKNGYCARYHKILEHLDVVRTGRPTYFGAFKQVCINREWLRWVSQYSVLDLTMIISPSETISLLTMPFPLPCHPFKFPSLVHWESPTSDMDSGDDSDNGSVIPANDLDAYSLLLAASRIT
ncbi:hypothetical protein BU17DRAFT_90219 [Hysterangium stoloniferum]|nr:hypothetical protein BU17DRAFT_90219 [Hysterangium stoloniferum]